MLTLIIAPIVNLSNAKIKAESVNFPWGGGISYAGVPSFPPSFTSAVDQEGSIFTAKYVSTGGGRIQKTDKYGNNQWGAEGVDFISGGVIPSTGDLPESISDGEGGAYVVSSSTINGAPQTYIQRILSDGTVAWQTNGIRVSEAYGTSLTQMKAALAVDESFNLVVAYDQAIEYDTNTFSYVTAVRVQKIDKNGNYLWGDGITVSAGDTLGNKQAAIITLDTGEFIVSWMGASSTFKAQKISTEGDLLWNDGQPVDALNAGDGYGTSFLADDKSGGAYIACVYCLKVNKINSDGTTPWGVNGNAVDSSINSFKKGSYDTLSPIATDSDGNVFIIGAYDSSNIIIDKWDATGTSMWDSVTTIVPQNTAADGGLSGIVTDTDDLIIAWQQPSGYAILTQKISSEGTPMWETWRYAVTYVNYLVGIHKSGPDEATISAGFSMGPNANAYVQRIRSAYSVSNLNASLDVVNVNGETITHSNTNGAYRDEVVKLKQLSDDKYIALVNLNTLTDMNWNSVTGSSNSTEGKAIASITGTQGVDSYSLLVPIKNNNDNAVIVCPEATSLNEITDSCSNKVTIVNTESAKINNKDVRLSISNIEGEDYWRVENLTSGGAMSTRIEAAGNNNNAVNTTNITNITYLLNPTPTDTDGDGLNDSDEDKYGTDKNKIDTDGDGLLDGYEVNNSGKKGSSTYLNPLSKDSDSDKIPDNEEDFDQDKLTNYQEQSFRSDPRDMDSDGDGLLDGIEVQNNTNKNPLSPVKKDSNNDGTPDNEEDFDKDALNNLAEQKAKTDFYDSDTDKDGLLDKEEVVGCIFNPNTLVCSDKMFIPTDPTKADTDNDGINDKEEALANLLNTNQYSITIPIANKENILQSRVNLGVVGLSLLVGVPLGYILLKGFRRKNNIRVV